ncbi:hypothetical protein Y032_0069g285 [Ancylostoma ceylanicum]|uniref:Uncharacterized protein n=1 Tax=Ancylostoma ceylanicum TaxID=53326 RepID=A0A016TXP6_9BILA|nr:hypothetical protein Y032_0069g285 [Ancylostoma ceylanicum]
MILKETKTLSAFAVVVFGSLLFGVYKEKRLYVVPYLVFQVISVGVTVIVLLSFIIAIAVKSNMVIDLAKDLGGVNIHAPQKELDAGATKAFPECPDAEGSKSFHSSIGIVHSTIHPCAMFRRTSPSLLLRGRTFRIHTNRC